MLLFSLAALGSLVLSACGAKTPEPTPTVGPEVIQTAAVGTFAAGLTQTAIFLPTGTATNTSTPSSTPPATATRVPQFAASPTAICYGLTGLKDVTIPDNAPMVAGQAFVKTWLVSNSGTCTWDSGFKLVFTSGDAMGGATLVLDKAVAPGAQVELSVPMTAPNKTGLVRGNWRMSTTTGVLFGDEQYVIISLGGPTSTATSTPTATPTGTATPTPTSTSTPTPTSTTGG